MNAQKIYLEIDADPVAAWIHHGGAAPDTKLAALPDYMRGGLIRYLLLGLKPGSFLNSVLAGEWVLAEMRADDTNRRLLDAYRAFLRDEAPLGSHGAPETVRAWCEQGGMLRREAA